MRSLNFKGARLSLALRSCFLPYILAVATLSETNTIQSGFSQ